MLKKRYIVACQAHPAYMNNIFFNFPEIIKKLQKSETGAIFWILNVRPYNITSGRFDVVYMWDREESAVISCR